VEIGAGNTFREILTVHRGSRPTARRCALGGEPEVRRQAARVLPTLPPAGSTSTLFPAVEEPRAACAPAVRLAGRDGRLLLPQPSERLVKSDRRLPCF
jgi:hypothetical protein